MPPSRELFYDNDSSTSVMSPLSNNIYAVLLTILYVKIGFEIASLLRWRMGMRRVPRIFFHLCLSTTILFWPLYDNSDWSWRLNCVVPCSMAARLLYKGVLLKDSEDEDVQIMTRTGSPFELMYGPLQLNLIMILLGIYHFMTTEAAVVVAAVGFGDSVAPWIGAKFGRHVYRMPFGRSKTMEGSVCGVFLGTVIGCYFILWFLGLPLLPLRILLAYGAIAAVAEGTAPSNMDNLTIPGVLYLSMERVIQWLPS